MAQVEKTLYRTRKKSWLAVVHSHSGRWQKSWLIRSFHRGSFLIPTPRHGETPSKRNARALANGRCVPVGSKTRSFTRQNSLIYHKLVILCRVAVVLLLIFFSFLLDSQLNSTQLVCPTVFGVTPNIWTGHYFQHWNRAQTNYDPSRQQSCSEECRISSTAGRARRISTGCPGSAGDRIRKMVTLLCDTVGIKLTMGQNFGKKFK